MYSMASGTLQTCNFLSPGSIGPRGCKTYLVCVNHYLKAIVVAQHVPNGGKFRPVGLDPRADFKLEDGVPFLDLLVENFSHLFT